MLNVIAILLFLANMVSVIRAGFASARRQPKGAVPRAIRDGMETAPFDAPRSGIHSSGVVQDLPVIASSESSALKGTLRPTACCRAQGGTTG